MGVQTGFCEGGRKQTKQSCALKECLYDRRASTVIFIVRVLYKLYIMS